ncbi:unnamed protein product [Closterium sp. Yama58-4]|nr:unnamed protein product [Closterium sp. Yama58-4]
MHGSSLRRPLAVFRIKRVSPFPRYFFGLPRHRVAPFNTGGNSRSEKPSRGAIGLECATVPPRAVPPFSAPGAPHRPCHPPDFRGPRDVASPGNLSPPYSAVPPRAFHSSAACARKHRDKWQSMACDADQATSKHRQYERRQQRAATNRELRRWRGVQGGAVSVDDAQCVRETRQCGMDVRGLWSKGSMMRDHHAMPHAWDSHGGSRHNQQQQREEEQRGRDEEEGDWTGRGWEERGRGGGGGRKQPWVHYWQQMKSREIQERLRDGSFAAASFHWDGSFSSSFARHPSFVRFFRSARRNHQASSSSASSNGAAGDFPGGSAEHFDSEDSWRGHGGAERDGGYGGWSRADEAEAWRRQQQVDSYMDTGEVTYDHLRHDHDHDHGDYEPYGMGHQQSAYYKRWAPPRDNPWERFGHIWQETERIRAETERIRKEREERAARGDAGRGKEEVLSWEEMEMRRLLGLATQGALTQASLKAAYHRCAKQWHPDAQHGLKPEARVEAERRFKLISSAYETLSARLAK